MCVTVVSLAFTRQQIDGWTVCVLFERFGFHIVSMSAADDNGEDLSDVPTLDFEAKLGQNIRQGLEGWNTRMTVQKVWLRVMIIVQQFLAIDKRSEFA